MTLSAADIVQLNALTELTAPAAGDIVPILRASPMQFARLSSVQGFLANSVKYYGAAGDGVTDDTGAIQSAMNAGLPFYFPTGVYLTSATLAFNQTASHGQLVSGAGPTARRPDVRGSPAPSTPSGSPSPMKRHEGGSWRAEAP